MKKQQIKKIYKDGKQYTKAYCNGQLIWSVMERPQDDNSEYFNVFEIEIPRYCYPSQDIVLHNLFGLHMKTEVDGQVVFDDDEDVHVLQLPVNPDGMTKYRIKTTGYINPDYHAPSRLFVTRIDKIALPNINDIAVDKQDLLRKYSPILFGMNKLRYANLSHLDLSNCENCNSMFSGLDGLINYSKLGYNKCEIVGADKTELYSPKNLYGMFSHCHIDIDDFNWIHTKNVKNMSYCFQKYSNPELHLETWDTSNVIYTDELFKDVENCKIYIGSQWTLSSDSNAYGGKNLMFIRVN